MIIRILILNYIVIILLQKNIKIMNKKIFLAMFFVGIFFYIVFYVGLNIANAGNVAKGDKCTQQTDCASGLYCENNLIFTNTCQPKIVDDYTCGSEDNCKIKCNNGKFYFNSDGLNVCGTEKTSSNVSPTAQTAQIQNNNIPGTSVASSGIVQCGRPGGHMCTLCDLIAGFNRVIHYVMEIAIGVALLAMAIGGVLYVVSAGESAMMEMAKSAITNAAIGFVIVFAAFLIVNTTISYLGAIKNAAGEPTLGLAITSWGQFNCTASLGGGTAANTAASNPNATQSTLVENDPCVQSQAPYCKDGLSCTGGKCVPDTTAQTTCADPKTQWVKTTDCSGVGVNLADWNCTACKGAKPSDGYKCCGNVAAGTGTVLPVARGCCLWPKGSYNYTSCFDGTSIYSASDCVDVSGNPGDYVANKKCVDITVGSAARKACQ